MAEETKSGKDDSSPKDGTDDAGTAKPGLQQLLKEFEEGQAAKAAAKDDSDKGGDDDVAALRKEVERLQNAEADRAYRAEMDETLIPTIKGDLEVHPKLVETWINEQAESDPRLMKLWQERGSNRREFTEAVEALIPEFKAYAEKEGIVGTGKTGDDGDKDLRGAIRGSRTTDAGDVTAESLGGLNDTEFALKKAEVFRQSAAGQLH